MAGRPDAPADVVTSAPGRLSRVAWAMAVVVAVGSVALALALDGVVAGSAASGNAGAGSGKDFEGGIRYGIQFTPLTRGMIAAFGLACAGLLLLFTRPRLRADSEGLHVRNAGGWRHLPWGVVRDVQLDESRSWMVVDLADDETVSVLAVQASDGERAREVVRRVRALHEQSGTRPGRSRR